MAVSLLALFVALAGTATAATLIKSSKQIRNGAVKGADLRNGTVSGKDIKDGSVASEDIDDGSVASEDLNDGSVRLEDLQSSARSAIEAAGTQAIEAFRRSGPESVPGGESRRVASLRGISAGTYAFFAKTVLTATSGNEGLLGQGGSIGGHCVLDADGEVDHSRALLGGPGANAPAQVNTQLTRTFPSAGDVTLTCEAGGERWRASDTTIIALRVGAAPRTEVGD